MYISFTSNSTIRLKKIKTRSKDPVEDIVVLSAGTIFVIRQRLALKRDYWLTHLMKFRKILDRFPIKEELVLLIKSGQSLNSLILW